LPWGSRLTELSSIPAVSLTWLGQSGFFIACDSGPAIAIDPFLTMWPDRLQRPLLHAEELPADLVLITHTHRDHLDADALPTIAQARSRCRFITPPTGRDKLRELGIDDERIVVLRPFERYEEDGVSISANPARHRPSTPDAQGYVIDIGGHSIVHTGDTELDPSLINALSRFPDVLLVPVNGRGGNMTAEQAAELAAALAPKVVIPMHYGCLQPEEDLVQRFLRERARVAAGTEVAIMQPGAVAFVAALLHGSREGCVQR
jgi:L-ascorbate 6-phosphate lactonase